MRNIYYCFFFLVYLIEDIIKCHVYIAGPEKLKKLFKEKTGRDELYSNFANYGKIPYGYTTVKSFVF